MIVKKIVGTSIHNRKYFADYELMKEAGIEWIRLGVGFPFLDEGKKVLNEKFILARENIAFWREKGFKILGITPGPGHHQATVGSDVLTYQKSTPDWMGDHHSDGYYEKITESLNYVGEYFKDSIEYYQIANEMDIPRFRGTMTADEAIRYMNASAKGIKAGNPAAKVGINPTSLETEDAYYFFRKMYSPENEVELDYAGIDYYFGSFHPGVPTDWNKAIDIIYGITGKPVLVNEWGYSSLGGYIPEGFPTEPHPKGENWICVKQAWPYAWKGLHNEEIQAEYFSIVMKIFAEHPHVIGSMQFDWRDDEKCWCGRSYCPHECGYGLVNRDGKPKKSFFTFQKAVREYYGE